MHVLMKFDVKVTTPYKLNDADLIRKDYSETIRENIKRIIQDELDNVTIGLSVEVKER